MKNIKWRKNLLIHLFSCSKGYRRYYFGAAVAAVVLAGCNVYSAHIVRTLVDSFHAGFSRRQFIILLLEMSLVTVAGFFAKYSSENGQKKAGYGTACAMRKEVSMALLRFPMKTMERQNSGETASKVNQNLSALESFMTDSMLSYVSLPAVLLLAMGYLLVLNWKLACVSFFPTPIAAFLIHRITKNMGKQSKNYYQYLEQESSIATESIKEVSVIKAYNLEDEITRRYDMKNQLAMKEKLGLDAKNTLVMPLIIIMNEMPYIVCAIAGGVMAFHGEITAGALIAFIQLLHILIGPATQVMDLISQYKNAAGAAESLFSLLGEKREKEQSLPCVVKKECPAIEFKRVTFTYKKNAVLKNISFSLQSGEQAAFIGESGSGKSTILRLIARFYEQQKGDILFWGQNAEQLSLSGIRAHISMVSQSAHIFAETIEENIRYGKPDADFEEVVEAAKNAGIHSFIESLPEGYQTKLSENGMSLSGGQKQRISIARAFLKNAEIVLLDEPDSTLDKEIEHQIQEAVNRLAVNRLVILVSHRMSALEHAQKIYVLKNGKIIDSGTREEMLQKNGYYVQQMQKEAGRA